MDGLIRRARVRGDDHQSNAAVSVARTTNRGTTQQVRPDPATAIRPASVSEQPRLGATS